MPLNDQTFSLIKPFTGIVTPDGTGTCIITHSLQGMLWQVFQIGFGLNLSAPLAQVGAHFNGIPLTAAVVMQPVAFTGVPYAMESYFVGPPYVGLKAGDQIVCSVMGGKSGDIFTAGAYISEEIDPTGVQPVTPSQAHQNFGRWR